MNELSQVLINQTGSVVVGVIALYFFVRISQDFSTTTRDISKEFSATIDRYLTKSTESSNMLAIKLQELSDSNKELRASNETVYKRLYETIKSKKS